MRSALATALALSLALSLAAPAQAAPDAASADVPAAAPHGVLFQPSETVTAGSVTIGGQRIAYHAHAGTLVVHGKDWSDTDGLDPAGADEKAEAPAQAAMFYTAYFRDGAPAAGRPITFLFNGGPGSSSVWLHMGAYGPMRVVTLDGQPTPAAPYRLVNNDQSLLDVSDLVFVDAPGTGFSRIAGKDADKSFYGVDQDIHAFTDFITQFLSRYDRWNSPKYIFGESYGTMRAAGLTLALQEKDVALNGVIMLSDILNWDLIPDDPQLNPAIDLPYIVSLPTYAATAWYHNRIPDRPEALRPFLDEVEAFATGDYALALMKGNLLTDAERQSVARRLAGYTGLPLDYLLRTNLRIEYGALQQQLLLDQGLTTGTLDTRFTGATLDPLEKTSGYDPQGSAIGAAYVGAFNQYVRERLNYGRDRQFLSGIEVYGSWDYRHQPPGAYKPMIALPNVLPDLAVAMKRDPGMKLLVTGGYFDISTPYFAGVFELRHLPVPANLQGNIEYRYFEAGHMVYVNPQAMRDMRDTVADFIRRTDNLE